MPALLTPLTPLTALATLVTLAPPTALAPSVTLAQLFDQAGAVALLRLQLPPAVVDLAFSFLGFAAFLLPLFLLASFLVGLAQAYLSPDRLRRSLQRRSAGNGNVAAALVGAVTPFCSCSSVPFVAGLLQAGAPLGIVFSFLLASPLVNEIAVPLLFGLFGWQVAVVYVLLMLTAAVLGGLLLGRLFEFEDHVDRTALAAAGTGTPVADGGAPTSATALGSDEAQDSHRVRVRRAARSAWSFFVSLLPYVLLGVLLATLVHEVVPVDWLRSTLGPANPLAVPLAVVAGVPLYFSLSAMLPVAGVLVDNGVQIGTVLALLVGTVGVSLPNLVMLSKLFSRRLLVAYVGAVVAIGLAAGYLFNALPV
jgi:uncharacterized membrane protein YraQ (UPF0718 family)